MLGSFFQNMVSLSENAEGLATPATLSRSSKAYHLPTNKWLRFNPNTKSCPLTKVPLFILLISLLETIVYYAADDGLKRILLYDTANRRQLWRFFTYMLLHTDELHLGLNVVIQGFLGTPLELEQGGLRCAVIYFGGGLAGSLGTSAFAAFSLMAGASGGVYALLTAQIPNVVLNYGTIKYAAYRIATVTLLTAADVAYVFIRVHFYNNERPKIGWVAHASGAVAGILLGFLVLEGTSKWRRKFRTASCAILALPFIFTVMTELEKYKVKELTEEAYSRNNRTLSLLFVVGSVSWLRSSPF